MADGVTVTTRGAKELSKFFDGLPLKVRTKMIPKAVRAGGSVLIKEIRQNIKSMVSQDSASRNSRRLRVRTRTAKRSGRVTTFKTSLAKSITQRVVKSRKGGAISVVGGAYPEGAHAHLVERGHRIVTKFGVDTGKRARPIPFQRKAESSAGTAVLRAKGEKMAAEIRKLRAK